MGATALPQGVRRPGQGAGDCGVDAILAEYVGWIDEAVAAVPACAQTGLPVFLGIRHIQEDGTMQYGERLEDLAAALRDSPVAGIMLMCSTPERITAGLRRLINAYDGPVGGYPNIGYMPLAPVDPDKPTMTNQLPSISGDFLQTADYYPTRLAGFAREWKEMGARIIGGCCPPAPSTSWPWRRPSADSMFRTPRRDGLSVVAHHTGVRFPPARERRLCRARE